MKTQYFLFALLGTMLVFNVAHAGCDTTNLGKQKVTAAQVTEIFSNPCVVTPEQGISRSIDMSSINATPRTKSKSKASKIPMVVPKAKTEVALSMEILFGYKSWELTDEAKKQLKPIGEGLASEKLQSLKFVVEGYTDAVGGAEYNKELSEQRAASVKRYLVDNFHIQPYRFQIIGKGESDLLDPTKPDSEVNRRVRIVAIK